jgi:hypothetical protein
MPDTALFENGKIKYIIKTDQEGCLFSSKNKLNLQELRRTFSIIVRERKKDTDFLGEGLNGFISIMNRANDDQMKG